MSLLPVFGTGSLVQIAGATRSAVGAASRSFVALLGGSTPAPGEAERSAVTSARAERPGEVRRRLERLLATFRGEVGKLFARHGIDSGTELHVRYGAGELIRVGEGHPQQRQLEALLNSQPGLVDLLAAVEQDARRLGADEPSAAGGVLEVTLSGGEASAALVQA